MIHSVLRIHSNIPDIGAVPNNSRSSKTPRNQVFSPSGPDAIKTIENIHPSKDCYRLAYRPKKEIVLPVLFAGIRDGEVQHHLCRVCQQPCALGGAHLIYQSSKRHAKYDWLGAKRESQSEGLNCDWLIAKRDSQCDAETKEI